MVETASQFRPGKFSLHWCLGLSKIMIVFIYVVIKLNYYDYNTPHTIF